MNQNGTDNKTATFYAVWHTAKPSCPCVGTPGQTCGDERYNEHGYWCRLEGNCCQ